MDALLYAFLCLIWGSTWLAIKVGLAGVPPFLGAGLRFVISATVLGVLLALRGQRIRLTREDKTCILSLGLLVFWLDYAAVYWAELRISSGLTAILFSTMPLMTALLSQFWTRAEALSGRKIAGIAVGMVGTALLFWPQEQLGLQQVLGMLAALFGSLCASVNLVTMKRYANRTDPLVLNVFGMALGAVCLLAMSGLAEQSSAAVWTWNNVLALLYLAVFGSVIAFTAYFRLIKVMEASTVSLMTLIIPIVALTLGYVFLGETLTPLAIMGIGIVLIGVAIAIVPTGARRAGAAVEPG
jgi:drug/metabolite transporter (DMT)-like permease